MISIRPFDDSDGDFEAVAAIANAVWPDEPINVEMLRHWESTRDPKYYFRRILAEKDGRVVASATYGDARWAHVPGKNRIMIQVHPEHQRQGVGSAVYDYIVEAVSHRDPAPTQYSSSAREDYEDSLAFLAKRGFEQVMRDESSSLDLPDFDASRFADTLRCVDEQGIAIRSIPEIGAAGVDWRRKLIDLSWEIEQDVPCDDPPVRQSDETYEKELDGPGFLPEACLIAMDGDRWVGLSMLWKIPSEPDKLYTALTGVSRSHRRRGVATALKVKCLEVARDLGYRRIATDNEEKNPMYRLNVALGFRPKPGWIHFKKILEK